MAVYVDDMAAPFKRGNRTYIMCHCWGDSREELFAMMRLIGVDLKYFQRPPSVKLPGMNASWEHFDITKTKRALAVKAGAIETDRYGPMEHVAKLEGNTAKIAQILLLRAKKARAPEAPEPAS